MKKLTKKALTEVDGKKRQNKLKKYNLKGNDCIVGCFCSAVKTSVIAYCLLTANTYSICSAGFNGSSAS